MCRGFLFILSWHPAWFSNSLALNYDCPVNTGRTVQRRSVCTAMQFLHCKHFYSMLMRCFSLLKKLYSLVKTAALILACLSQNWSYIVVDLSWFWFITQIYTGHKVATQNQQCLLNKSSMSLKSEIENSNITMNWIDPMLSHKLTNMKSKCDLYIE